MQPNKAQITAAIQIARAAYDAIAESGPHPYLINHVNRPVQGS